MTWTSGGLRVVRFLPSEESLRIFDKGNQENQSRTEDADSEHSFENPHQKRAQYGDHESHGIR